MSSLDLETSKTIMTTTQHNSDGLRLSCVDIDMHDSQSRPHSTSSPSETVESLAVHGEGKNRPPTPHGTNISHKMLEEEPGTFSQSTRQHTEQFLAIMDKHRESMKNDSFKLSDLRAKTSWEEVLKAAKKAETAYRTASQKPLRKAGYWITQHSESALPFLRLIPSDGYGSTFYGGLRIIFEAASQLAETRSKVLKSFLRIPKIILLAESCVSNFPLDRLLYQRAEEVFLAALPAIEGTINWLRQHPGMKQVRALLLGSRYNKSFKDKIQNLDEALNELQERASFLRDQSICNTEAAVANVKQVVNHTDTQISTVLDNIKSSVETQEQTRSMVNNINDLEEIRRETKQAMSMVLEQTIKTSEWMEEKDRAIRRLKDQLDTLEKLGAALTRDELLDLLDVRAEDVREELGRLQRACQSIETSSYQATLSILQSSRMKAWLSVDAATLLFIEARPSSRINGRITSLSLLSTEVIGHLRDKEPAVAIYFFCGYHSSLNDSIHGPIGMMRSLISQLLHLYPIQLDFISRRISRQLEDLHLHTLCNCFYKLVKRLPHSMVLVCIIDGVSFLERKEWESDCQYVMHELREILNDDQVPPIFKLLITSPARSRYIAGSFLEQHRWTLPEAGDGRLGPTLRNVDLARTRKMEPVARKVTTSKKILRHRQDASSESSIDDWFSDMSVE